MKKGINLFGTSIRILLILMIAFIVILTTIYTHSVKAKTVYHMPLYWQGQNCDTLHDPGSKSTATFQGISACYGSPNRDPDIVEYLGGTPLLEWECVELAMRYMLLTYSIVPYPTPDGTNVAPDYNGNILLKETNPSLSIAPQVGDIISFGPTNDNASGHVAIVDKSQVKNGSGTIEIFQQNSFTKAGKPVPFETLQVTNWKIVPHGDLGAVTTWLHYPGASPTPTATPTNTPTPTASSTPPPEQWSVVSSPNNGTTNALSGVTAVSANDVWSVGYYVNSYNVGQTLIEQWNGTSWSIIPSPNSGMDDYLDGVTAISANDVWAVGSYYDSGGYEQTLIEQWNGTSWSIVPSPNSGTNNYLYGVTAVSANDIWAVGFYDDSGGYEQTLIEQWNGTSWSIVPSSNNGSYDNGLNSVVAISTNNVWAIGSSQDSGGTFHSLIEQWNGTNWSIVPTTFYGILDGVTAVSSNDVWAVGYDSSNLGQTLIEQWNGTSWSVVPSPNVNGRDKVLSKVVAISANNVWAVGSYENNLIPETLIEQWNGTTWSVVPSPNPGTNNALYGVTAITANDVWAVGDYDTNNDTLIEHYT